MSAPDTNRLENGQPFLTRTTGEWTVGVDGVVGVGVGLNPDVVVGTGLDVFSGRGVPVLIRDVDVWDPGPLSPSQAVKKSNGAKPNRISPRTERAQEENAYRECFVSNLWLSLFR